ncbi:MAG: epimerase [Acidobacteria bacterium]|nr:epimerase [Acidobacteriota bacterium]
MRQVFISGATGYLGRPLTELLSETGFEVYALARPQSLRKLPKECIPVPGDALRESTFVDEIPYGATVVHLTGVAHPSPAKAAEFRSIDQASFEASLAAAMLRRAVHFVYVSVAHPAPVMKDYVEVRTRCEARLRSSGLTATVLRPWYVLGPGHWWPAGLIPFYAVAAFIPRWRAAAERLGLVTHEEMVNALAWAIANPPMAQTMILDVPSIRQTAREAASASALAL